MGVGLGQPGRRIVLALACRGGGDAQALRGFLRYVAVVHVHPATRAYRQPGS
jgi:hypothetical protein